MLQRPRLLTLTAVRRPLLQGDQRICIPTPSDFVELLQRVVHEPPFMFDADLFREILGIPPASKERGR